MDTITPLVFRQMRWAALPTRIRMDTVRAFADRRGVSTSAAMSAIGVTLRDVDSADWPLLDELLTDALGELQRAVMAAATCLFEGWAAAVQQMAAGFAAAVEASRVPAVHDGRVTLAAGDAEAGTAATPGTSRTRPASPVC